MDDSLPTTWPACYYRLGMLGEALRKARQAAGMTQEQLSFAAGIDRSYISQLEHDKKSPTVDTLFRLCDAVGVRPSVLVFQAERERRSQS